NLAKVVRTLLTAGWHVEAEGKVYRQPGTFQLAVSSGIDWFELHGQVDFDGHTAALPALLAALKRGDNTVRLDDGTVGVLPEEWLKKYGLIAGLGKVEGDHLRFTRSQTGLLDALLAAQPDATWDAAFTKARDELRHFEGIEPVEAPAGFVGQLRGYQRDGLGWLHFLQKFGFGGCLADDMGLGKTVQVLALLESRREQRAAASNGQHMPPSLVVVPKSLVFNWKEEAARFTPALKVLDHTGMARLQPGPHFQDYDLILTTYGTLRRDAAELKDIQFDYCILDEAQAIKNASTASAKASRLLQANHRLILSGTPVENHLGELGSLFEFLNPGMLGTASVFQLTGAGARNPSEETRQLLAKALRPFILRRTKEQVAKDLPEKLEQTIHCELDAEQRKRYDELRDHYRRSLLGRIESVGLNKAKMQVLEALLRLRQAACHPGLIDKKRADEPSAKLDNLLPQLAEVLDGGHKVLVFSQFTSFLAIVRDRLDKDGIAYEYLDGRTRDRAARVERFQNDPDCKLFLISLKAGGLGLNLTAAEYVFLLDPWWNPAVEAQAIDRAHRIGQTKPVFAYRLIAKDTVEEKVLELQKTKRDLADAIINADNSLIRNLGREELELLLS
ncbi:MAG TPA: DEAD/DEAH box helicase, partial [Gemmataceae bacterium]|nr:DEAD/DEAH box helicase [Gemmataceae bacterium]